MLELELERDGFGLRRGGGVGEGHPRRCS
jgi:hypothetical protein